MGANKILDLSLTVPTVPDAAVTDPQLSSEQAHKMLLHSGYHLVHHHEATQPHLPHGIGTLICILVLVHLVAISYLVYLFTKPMAAASRGKPRRGSDLKPIKCEDDWLRNAGRAIPGKTSNV